jgi:hypothetical protein
MGAICKKAFFQFVNFSLLTIKMCKHDKLFIDKKDAEIHGPDHIKAAYDPLKLKR